MHKCSLELSLEEVQDGQIQSDHLRGVVCVGSLADQVEDREDKERPSVFNKEYIPPAYLFAQVLNIELLPFNPSQR